LCKKTHPSGPAVAARRRLASTVVQTRDGFIGHLTRQHCDELDHISTCAPTMLTSAVLAHPQLGVIAATQRIIRLMASFSTCSSISSMSVRTIRLRVAGVALVLYQALSTLYPAMTGLDRALPLVLRRINYFFLYTFNEIRGNVALLSKTRLYINRRCRGSWLVRLLEDKRLLSIGDGA